MFDSHEIQDDLALHINSLSGIPVAKVLQERTEYVLAVRRSHNPPVLVKLLTREDGFAVRGFGV